MSQPISVCMGFRAARGDEEAYRELMAAFKSNIEGGGHWSQFPCSCDPPCEEATEFELDELNRRMKEDAKDWSRPECPEHWPPGEPGEPGEKGRAEQVEEIRDWVEHRKDISYEAGEFLLDEIDSLRWTLAGLLDATTFPGASP